MSAAGAALFARYAYPPNELGYCGPDGAAELLRPGATAEIERRARDFDGAWTYLELLAEAAGTPDPLDARVVEAYWVGNDLLDRVEPGVLVERLRDRFRTQPGGTWRQASARAVAHHSFHVFDVYPWAGLLQARGSPAAVAVLDLCRIRTGRVLRVDGEAATVHSHPLRWDGTALTTGPPQQQTVRWSVGGLALIHTPAAGDRVALHWDWVCDTLTDEQCARLESLEYTELTAVGIGRASSIDR